MEDRELRVLIDRLRLHGMMRYERTLGREGVEDLLQETLLRGLERWDRYDSRKGSMQTWLQAIMYRISINKWRAGTLKGTIEVVSIEGNEDEVERGLGRQYGGEGNGGKMNSEEYERKIIERCRLVLGKRKRMLITLEYIIKYIDYYHYGILPRMARAMGIGESTLKSRMHMMRGILRMNFDKFRDLFELSEGN